MRRLVAATMVIALVVCLLLPFGTFGESYAPGKSAATQEQAIADSALAPRSEGVNFPEPLNTSLTVEQYPMVSRPLMLPGGSTDATLADMNKDGLTDLVVTVSNPNVLSVFLRLTDGSFPTYPSSSTPLVRVPIEVTTVDVLGTGSLQVAVLEKRTNDFDTEYMGFYNYTSETAPLSEFFQVPLHNTANAFVTGDMNGDEYPDFAFSCPGLAPSIETGVIELRYGPYYSSPIQFYSGTSLAGIIVGHFNEDGLDDLATANHQDRNVNIFYQPFYIGKHPDLNLTLHDGPIGLASGLLNDDDLDDIAVLTDSQPGIHFFFQSQSSGMPSIEFYNRTLEVSPSAIETGDLNGDALDDIVILSGEGNVSLGFLQKGSGTIWNADPDFGFPVGAIPRGVLVGNLDGDSGTDMAIASARADWSGSSIAIYPSRPGMFSNSNATAWASKFAPASMFDTGDIDGNGTDDLVFLYTTKSAFGYMLSGSGSGFSLGEYVQFIGFDPSKLLVDDFNNDTRADIVISESGGPHVVLRFWKTSSPGSFSVLNLSCTGIVSDIAVGDFNNDTLRDIVAATESGTLEFFFNTGNVVPFASNADEIVYSDWIENWSVAVGDFNSDGLDDLAYPYPDAKIGILLQSSDSPHMPQTPDYLLFDTGANFTRLWAGDVTGDGKTDISAMRPLDPKVYFFDQDDFTTTYDSFANLALPELPRFLSVADATDDGISDVLGIFDSADLLFLYRILPGEIPQTPSMVFVTGAAPNYAMVGDGTQDNRADLLVGDSGSFSVSIWAQINTAPVADAGGPYVAFQGDPLKLIGSVVTGRSELPYMQYRWIFGDGNESDWSSSPVAIHEYRMEGPVTAVFEAKDPGGKLGNDSTSFVVQDAFPHVDFTWLPENPGEGESVVLSENYSAFDPVVMINWTIDGTLVSSGMEHSILRVFQNGTYAIDLNVTDADGSMRNRTKLLVVGRLPPEVTIVAPSSASEGGSVGFWAVVDPWHTGVGDTIVSYEWNFSFSGSTFYPDELTGTLNHTDHVFRTSQSSENFIVAVRATDSDGDWAIGLFDLTVFDNATVELLVDTPLPLHEFQEANFSATVDSYFAVISYQWDFEADLETFTSDITTLVGQASHTYDHEGNFLVKLRATLANGSHAWKSIYVSVSDVVPVEVALPPDLVLGRNPDDTSNMSFDASALAERYPDIMSTVWDFGDGTGLEIIGGPSRVAHHKYVPDKNYQMTLNITDDEQNSLVIERTLRLVAPTIQLVSPVEDSVIRPGMPVRFAISDDTPPLVSVRYSLNGGQLANFTSQWEISTASWSDGDYSVVVSAEDADGNIAIRSDITISIDSVAPAILMVDELETVWGGDEVNFTVRVVDENIDPEKVVLNVKFPGDKMFSPFLMLPAGDGIYYALVKIPEKGGELVYNITAEDLAENSGYAGNYGLTVRMHFIDEAWPFLLALAVLAAMGTGLYFFREAKIAVDETFVIYNDGRLISHSTRRLKPGMDDQVLGGMLTAIQDFVKDSFKDVTSFTLRKLEFGEKSVLIEKGDHLYLAVILHGKASKKVASKMQQVVDEIEEVFSKHLRRWDGDLDALRGVNDIVKKLYSRAPLLPGLFARRES